ncbi:uncharacterized protein [Gossypium hirsutum]|uniref:Retrovirus-related Pol polyprotein from transposon TNT 1-94-like beta-barrel domain-containing protein n=1 Tax=Gossypium hirsutum TaxID=3635 RepID=A0A1U8PGI4_GOSHI|nr:uncharacterized protein LOC107958920 [Gossypium hirsutum]
MLMLKPPPLRANSTVAWIRQHFNNRAKSIRLLGDQFSEARIVEKVISTLPERYKAKISSLEDSRDLLSISLTKLINALYARNKEELADMRSIKKVHFKPRTDQPRAPLAIKGSKHGQTSLEEMEQEEDIHLAHTVKRLKTKAQVAEESCGQEEQVFAVSCSATKRKTTKGWLIDSGCTNHMTLDAAIFKSIDRSFNKRVKVGNGHYIKVEDKGDVLIDTPSGTKLVSNVLLVPEIDKNLLSITQLLEKGYSIVFKGKECLISDPRGSKLMSVTMTDRSFIVDWNKNSVSAYMTVLDKSVL